MKWNDALKQINDEPRGFALVCGDAKTPDVTVYVARGDHQRIHRYVTIVDGIVRAFNLQPTKDSPNLADRADWRVLKLAYPKKKTDDE